MMIIIIKSEKGYLAEGGAVKRGGKRRKGSARLVSVQVCCGYLFNDDTDTNGAPSKALKPKLKSKGPNLSHPDSGQ